MLSPQTAATSPSTALSPAQTLVDGRISQKYSAARRYVLLAMFCLAQFLDSFNNGALYLAIPELVDALGMTESESTWLISAFQLTFASFLLIVSGRSGRMDVGLALTVSSLLNLCRAGVSATFTTRVRASYHLRFSPPVGSARLTLSNVHCLRVRVHRRRRCSRRFVYC